MWQKAPALFPWKTSSQHYPCPAGHCTRDTQPLGAGNVQESGSKVIFLLGFFPLFRQKTVVEQIFSGFFFFFLLGLAKPQPLKNFDGNGRFPLVDFIPISPGRQRRPSGGSPLFFGRGAPSPPLSQCCLCHATRCWRDELPLQPHTHKLDQAAAVPQLQEIVLLTSEVAEVTAAAWREGTKIKQPPLPCRKCLNPVFVFTCQIRAGVCSRCGAGVNQGCLQQD